ncbi:alpha-amylase family glycosyl hydrolase [Pontimicrobium sp. IMCC45349]|uniref:alpha-amylase family glycosyl hydrolase n=1 Tax=Pontimicrobium sp. IMCC45349 TaxID=3391574 RepID=UPI0039A39C5B
MKRLLAFILVFTVLVACKEQTKTDVTEKKEEVKTEIEPVSVDMMETAIIYEANIRQYSPEGTFDEFTKDIPEIKKLGVKVIWLMPIFPISKTNRKATGGKFASEFPEEEQAKYLGSYYAVTDFTKINPEFGTIEDFRELVQTAHDNGIYVILDWVPNHTGWDHTWLTTNPDYYTQVDGKVIHPEGTDWTDVADLNYDNQDMRKAMIADMMYWITEEGIDGFRCDVAGSVPTNFWEEAIPQLRAKKELFMLAEAWEPELLKGELFDMAYAWDGHHLMNAMAKGEKGIKDFEDYMTKTSERYEADDILMNFVTNHDENSWNGTIKERMGDASELMTALSYIKPGMPLIYTGQEYDLSHRLKFFEKDSIPKTKGATWELLDKLGKLKTTSSALNGGKKAASFTTVDTDNDNVLNFFREKNGVKVSFIGNFSNEEQQVTMKEGKALDYMSNSKVEFKSGDKLTLKPYEYKILID